MGVSFILSITLYHGWVALIVCLISFLPPFIAFIKMKQHNEKDLQMLYKTYVLFVIIIGIPLLVGGFLFSFLTYPEALNDYVVWEVTAFATLVLLVFRLIIAIVIKKKW
jgi:hypothetical protein